MNQALPNNYFNNLDLLCLYRSWWEKAFSTAAFLNVGMELEQRPISMPVAATSTPFFEERFGSLVGFGTCFFWEDLLCSIAEVLIPKLHFFF